jgi:hypothetical protein
MVNGALADKLLDLCQRHADDIAELWWKATTTNARTQSYSRLQKDAMVRHAATFYRNLKQLYFAENPYTAIQSFLETNHYLEYTYENNIPVHEAVYALIIMRRHIWLYAEMKSILYNNPLDLYQALESVNRTILLFDYAIYIVTQRYDEMSHRH